MINLKILIKFKKPMRKFIVILICTLSGCATNLQRNERSDFIDFWNERPKQVRAI